MLMQSTSTVKKAVISNRIYLSVTPELEMALEKSLTYVLPLRHKEVVPVVICDVVTIRPGLISIPSGRQDLIPSGYEIIDKRVSAPIEFCQPKISLRVSQQQVVDEWESSGLLHANTSFGKTFTAIHLIAKLKQKTLVVLHTVALRDQWFHEIKKVLGITPSIIGSGGFDTRSPITIANIQTLRRRIDTNPELNSMFGTIIIDEAHLSPAKTFNDVIDASKAKNKIALSATPIRKDGKSVYLYDYFDKYNIVHPKEENAMTPEVHIYITKIPFPFKQSGNWSKELTKLYENKQFMEHIFHVANAYATLGYQCLVPADRVFFLETLHSNNGAISELVTAKTEDREEIFTKFLQHKKEILYASTKIVSTGISINTLSCLVLTAPINNESLLTQLIGRIKRVREGKHQPIIVDTFLTGGVVTHQQQKRIHWYEKQGWKIKYI